MIEFLFGASVIINIFFISIIILFFKNKKCREYFKKEVENEKAFKYFFDSNRIDF